MQVRVKTVLDAERIETAEQGAAIHRSDSFCAATLRDACGPEARYLLVSPQLYFSAKAIVKHRDWDGPALTVASCDWMASSPTAWAVTAVPVEIAPPSDAALREALGPALYARVSPAVEVEPPTP